ncbi:MAG: helix-turn-helix transcriptional regulator [Planctomycetes bacterium]|nr:helix-turn-helix transcriptional regulator [Planctomycetota bacterium]MCB9905985.1 helix-turn-helix transcriptional regulator [Planctomycetota bacterium]
MIHHDLLFRAAADVTRRRLLHLLDRGEHCVGDLTEILGLPQPTVSRHLARLRNAGLVSVRREAPWVHYRLAISTDPLRDALLEAVRRCANDPIFAADLARADELAREGGCCPDRASAASTALAISASEHAR